MHWGVKFRNMGCSCSGLSGDPCARLEEGCARARCLYPLHGVLVGHRQPAIAAGGELRAGGTRGREGGEFAAPAAEARRDLQAELLRIDALEIQAFHAALDAFCSQG